MKPLQISWFGTLEGLPSLPSQMLNVLDEVGRTSAMDYNIVRVIQYDAPIACRVLKAANAPLYGYAEKISSLQQASGLLGPGAIKNIILTTPVLERFSRPDFLEEKIDFPGIWKHGSAVAALAGGLGKFLGNVESDVCFTGGLIHDIGKIALAAFHPRFFIDALTLSEKEKIPLQEAERKTLGFCHADISRELTRRWGIPPALVDAVGSCSGPAEEIADRLAAVLRLAKHLAIDWGYPDGMEFVEQRPAQMNGLFPLLGISEKTLKEWKPELLEYANFAIGSLGE